MGQRSAEPNAAVEEAPSCTIDHPLFREARLLNDKQGEYIQIAVPVINENEIASWEKRFRPLIAHESLLLPLSYEFKKTELCGANGVCKVPTPTLRSDTIIIPSCSGIRSTAEQ